MSTPRTPIDQVLDAINQLLSEPGSTWVDPARVHQRLKWQEDRLQEVKDHMAELLENGDVRGPRSGRPLTDGAGRVLDVDVRSVTPQGRRRLALAHRSPPRRAWDAAGARSLGEAWKIAAVVIAGVVLAAIVAWLRLK